MTTRLRTFCASVMLRLLLQILALTMVLFGTPATATTVAFATNSLIIPMDATYQNYGMWKAYGLVYRLLQKGVPVSWAIGNPKTPDTFGGVDFSATTIDDRTSAVIPGPYAYTGGPFVIDSTNAAAAQVIINAWWAANGNQPVVHKATAPFTAEVNIVLRNAPRIALEQVNSAVVIPYFNAAGIPDKNGSVWSSTSPNVLNETMIACNSPTSCAGDSIVGNGALFSNGPCSARTFDIFITPHNDGYPYSLTDPANLGTQAYAELDYFTYQGGGWTALCYSIATNENKINDLTRNGSAAVKALFKATQPGGMLTQFGFPVINNIGGAWTVDQPDLPLSQAVPTTGATQVLPWGSVGSWHAPDGTAANVQYWPGTERVAHFQNGAVQYDWGINGAYHNGTGNGKITFLGGHVYSTAVPYSTNSQAPYLRFFFNSIIFNGAAVPKLTLNVTPATVPQGVSRAIQIAITNGGASPAQNVQPLIYVLAAGFTYVSTTGLQPTSVTVNGDGTTTISYPAPGTIAPATSPIVINATVFSATTGTFKAGNLASTFGDFSGEQFSSNDCASIVVVASPGVAITKTPASQGPLTVGSIVSWNLSYSNPGGSGLLNPYIEDILPTGLTLVSATPAPTFSVPVAGGTRIRWNLASPLAAGASGTITLRATLQSNIGQPYTNSVTMRGSDTTGTLFTSTSTAQVSVDPPLATLAKVVSPLTSVNAGATLTYTLSPSSPGPVLFNSIRFFDAPPANTTFVAGSANLYGTFGAYVPQAAVAGIDSGGDPVTNVNITAGATPFTYAVGSTVTVTMSLNNANSSSGAITNVTAALNPSDGASTCAPLSAQPVATIAVNSTANVTFTCTIGSAGEITWDGSASGTFAASPYDFPIATSPSILGVPTTTGTNIVQWIPTGNTTNTVDVPSSAFTAGTGPGLFAWDGNGLTSWERYDISAGTWVVAGIALPAAPGAGAVMAYDGNGYANGYVYALRGNVTNTVWRYKLSNGTGGTWTAAPPAVAPWNVGTGGALARLGTQIYALQGGGATGFAVYDITSNTWTAKASVPATVGAGGSLATDGTYIYTLRGNNQKNFYRYNVATNAWTAMAIARWKVNAGGSLVAIGTKIYAQRGGSNNFALFTPNATTGAWVAKANIPATVAGGSALATDGAMIWTSRGNGNKNLYSYNTTSNTWTTLASSVNNINTGGALVWVPGASAATATNDLSAPVLVTGSSTNPATIQIVQTLTSSTAVTGITPSQLTVVSANATPASATPAANCSVDKPAPQSIVAGGTLVYTWTCTNVFASGTTAATSLGTLTFTAGASGTSPATTWAPATSNSVLVTQPLTYQVTVNAAPTTFTQVTNTGLMSDDVAFSAGVGSNSTVTSINRPPNLDLQKSAVPGAGSSVSPGSTLTYTVAITNTSVGQATAVIVTDAVPANTTYSSCTVTGGTINTCNLAAGTVTYNVGTIAGFGTASLTLVVTADTPAAAGSYAISNTASVTYTGVGGPFSGASNAVANTLIAVPAVSMTKAESVSPPADVNGNITPGSTITYTMAVTNPAGSVPATGVAVTDVLPTGTSYASCTTTTGSCAQSAGTVTYTLGAMSANANATLTLVVTVNNPSANGATILNGATVRADTNIAGSTYSSQSNLTSYGVTASAVLSMVKSASPTSGSVVNTGDVITYTLVIKNTGNANTPSAHITDAIPAGTTYVTGSTTINGNPFPEVTPGVPPTAGSMSVFSPCCPDPTGDGGTLVSENAAGGTANDAIVTFQVTVTAPDGIATTIQNQATGATEAPGVIASNTTTHTTPPKADLSITKTNGVASVNAGGTTTYTITVTNNGPSEVTNATVTDTAPAGMTLGNWTCSVTNAGSGGSVTTACGAAGGSGNISTTATMKSGAIITYTVPATISAGASGTIANTASVAVPAGITDATPGNNSQTDSDTVNVTAVADVTTTLTLPASAAAGSAVSGTVTFSNTGPGTAAGMTYTLALSPGLSGVSFSGLPGGATATYSAATGGVTFTGMPPTIASGATVSFTVNFTAPASGSVSVNSSIGTTTSQGTNLQPDSAAGSTAISAVADVTTSVTMPASAIAASTVSGSVVFRNNGPSTAAGVSYTLGLPPGLSGVNFTGLPGGATATYNAGTGAVAFSGMPASLAAAQTITIGVSYTAPASGSFAVNTSIGTSTSQGVNTLPDTATGSTAISPLADVTTSVTMPASAVAAAAVSGSVTYSNNGPSTAASVTYALGLPPGLSNVTFSGLPGGATATYSAATGAVTFTGMPSSLTSAQMLSIGVGYTAPASGSVTVASSIGTATSQGPNTLTDSASGTTAISPLADVTTSVSVPPTAVAATTVNGSVSYSNTGPSSAVGMTYLLGLAPGLSNVTFTGLPGTATAIYDSASGAVTFSNMPTSLAAGATITIGVSFTAPASGSVMVMTSIGTSTSQGPNTQPDSANGTTAISPLADVTTSISMPPTAVAGSAVSGTVTFTNTGPSTAAGTTFILGLPPGLSNVTFTGLPGGATASYDASSGAVTFTGMPVSLGASSSITIGIGFTAPPSGSVIIASEIGTTTSQGPNTLADTATSTTAVSPLADVTTAISLPVSAIAGSTVNGTVTYGNNGPSTATGMTYSLGLPPGLAGVTISSLPPGAMASYNAASGAVTFSGMPPSLGAGSSLNIGIAYTAPTSGSVTTTSSIGTATSEGTNTLPNSASVTTAISPLADVTTSISIPANAVAGTTVNGSVVYTNNGPSTAAGVTYTLGLPPGLSGVSFSGLPAGATASYDPATGAVNFAGMPASLGAGSTITVGVTFTAPASGSVTVASTIGTTSSQGANAAPDSASATTAISPLADVTTTISIPATAVASSTVNGTVTFTNNGPSTAAGVSYTLGLAPGLSGVGFAGLPGSATATYNAGSGAVTFTGMPTSLGASSTIALGLTYTTPTSGAVTVASSIGTTTAQGANAAPDTASATTAVSAVADVTTTVNVAMTAVAGSTVSGTISYDNNGPSTAAGVTYTLGLPPGLTGVTLNGLPPGAMASYDPATGAVTFSAMPTSLGAGSGITVGLSFTAPANGSVVVTSGIGTASNQGPNTLPDSSTSTTAISPLADVTVAVTVPATASAATTINSTVTFSNSGPSTAAGMTYTLNLAPGLSGVGVTGLPGGAVASYNAGNGVVTLTGMPSGLGAGSSITLNLSYTAPASGSVTVFSAVGTSTSQGANAQPDSAFDTTAISPVADVTTTVSAPPTAVAGSTVNSSVTYTNSGPSTANGMSYALNLASGLSGVSISGLPPGAMASYNAATGLVTLTGMPTALGAGASINLGVAFTAPASGAVTVSSTIATTTAQGANTAPDSANATTAISPLADVTTTVSVPAAANAGTPVSATVTYKNNGPSTAAGVTYTLTLAAGLTGVSVTGLPGGAMASYNPGTGAVTLSGMPASLGAGSTITLTVGFNAPSGGSATVSSAISTTTGQGANAAPDSAGGTTTVSALADVTTTLALPATATAGNPVSGSLTYGNVGASTAAAVAYALALPPGLAGVGFTGLPGGATATYNAGTGAVTFTGLPATLSPASSFSISVNFTAPASGSVTANSTITTTTSQGANPQPDSATATTAISPLADVTTSVTIPASAIAGATVNGSVSFTNTGPSTAAGATYALGLPPGLSNVTLTGLPAGATATYDPSSGAVTFAGMPTSLTSGSSINVALSYTAPPSGSVSVTATIGTSTSQGPNTQPDTMSAATAISPLADVSSTITAPATAVAASTVTATVSFSNAGPSTATSVTYTLGMPPGLSNVAFIGLPAGASASYDSTSGAVTFTGMPSSLNSSATIGLNVSYTAPASGSVTLTSSIGTATSQGPNTLPDSASATTAISPLADVTTSVSLPPTAVAASTVNGSVSFSNSGPSTAAGMTYLLGLAPGLSNVVLTGVPAGATATYDAASGAVTFTNMPTSLASGATMTIGVSFTAPASGSVMAMTSIGTSTSQGPNTAPDSASGTTAISPLADVTTSISMPPSAVAGTAVNGTVTYTNTGPSTASGTMFILGLPPGLSGVTLTGLPAGATATYDPASGAVTFTGMPTSLGAGSSISVGVAFTAPPSGSVIIASEIGTSTSQGPNTLTDTTTSTTAISPLADVTTTVTLPASAVAGGTVNGSVTYSNSGPSTAAGTIFTLGLPPGLTGVSFNGLPAGAMASYNPASGAVTYSGMPASLGSGSAVSIGVTFTAPPSGTVTASSSIQTTTSQGGNALADSASSTTAISPLADVTTSVTLPATAAAASTVNGSVSFSNVGPSTAAGVSYSLGLPPGLSNVLITGLPAGATAVYDPVSGAVNFTSMPMSLGAGASITLGVSFTAPASGAVSATAAIDTSTSQGPNTQPDTATSTAAISPRADVSASVSLPATAVAGSTVNGTVTFGNNGPSTAAGVTYTVGLPPGLANVLFTGLPGGATATYAPATGAVTLAGMPASLGAGTTIPINVSFTAPPSGAVVVSVGIGTSTSQGPNTLPDTSTSTTAISPLADVGASVSVPATANAGAPVSGTVTFSNNGPSTAAGVTYTLGFPPGLTGVTFSGLPAGATASYDSSTGAVLFAGMPTSLGSGSSIVAGIGFNAPASGSVAVTAMIDTTTSQGANAISDTDTGTTAVSPLADVTTTISAPPTAVAGTTVNATVTFSNVGPSSATGVTYTLSLAPGLNGVVITGLPLGATASYNPATGAITLNGMPISLGAGSGITLGVAFVAPASGSVAVVSNISTATSQGLNAQPDSARSSSAISPLADVTVSVTIPATAAAGATVSGSVNFSNNGPSTAAGLTYALTFPAGLAGVSVSGLPPGAMATYNPATGAVTFSGMPTALGAGSSVVLGVTFTAPASGSVSVSAGIGTTTSQGANASPDSDTQTTAISAVADVTTSVSVPPTAVAGNTVNGTVTYSNAGPSTATGLAYTLNLGAGLSGVTISGLPPGATAAYSAATGAVTFTGMPVGLGSGSSLSLGVTFTAPPSGAVSVNSQISTATSQGANTLADSAVRTTAISPLADVTTSVSVPPTATAGTTVNATVTYSNAGPSTAAGVTYALTLAPGLSGVIFSGLPPGATVTYNAANGSVVFTGMPTSLGAGSALTIGVSYTAPLNGGAVAVTSGITTTTSQGPNTQPDVSTSTTAISANADVTTTVSVPATAAAGGTVSGTVTYGNAGPSPASGVTYSLGLSTGLAGVIITGLPGGATATYDPATGGVTFTGMPTSLPSGTTLSLSLGFNAPATGTVMVSSGIGTSTAQGANTLPDTATGSTAISAVADVTTSIAVPVSAVAGTTVNATVTFRNAGPSTAAGVIYGIGLPPGLTGVTFSGLPAGAMASYDPSSGAVTLSGLPASLNAGASVPIGVSFTAPATGSVVISSSIGTSTGQGANTLPDAGTSTTAVSPLADVTTTISLPPTATAGTTVNGTVTFSNTGPSTAAAMTYTLGLPPGLAGVVFSGLPPGATATYNPSSGAVILTGLPATLNSGAGVSVGISFTASSSGAVTANSSVGTSTSQGSNAQPDSATATTAISPLADVTTSISLPATATAGATVNGTITYTNAGPSIAAGMTYTLGLPPGLVGVTFTGLPAGATAAYNAATGAVTFTGLPGSLGQGASVGFSISFTAPTTGAVTMTSAVSTLTSQGPNALTDSATATTAISPLADVTTSVSLPPTAIAASTVNGTITFSNAGPSTAAGVAFTIGMASGLTNVVFTGLPAGATATYDPASGAVTLAGLPATLGSGSNVTIGIAFTAPATGLVTITSAIATTSSQGPNTLADSASAITAISPLADVTANVSLPATATAGATVNGSVTFSNAGPSAASGITFALGLPPGLVGVSFTGLPAGASATYDVATGAVTFAGMPANLGAGSGFTIGVTFTAPPSGSVTVTASIGTSTSQGPNTLPDSASATSAISPIADVTASVSLPPQVIAGTTVNGTVTFSNAGPSTANGVSYQIGLPPGLSGVSFNGLPAGAAATYNAATGAVTFNAMPVSLGAGATLTLGVTFTAPASGSVAVTATMGTSTGQGPNTLPDSATATTAISPLADVTTSVSVPPSAVAGSIVNGSVTFSNAGPSTASGITYSLTLPSGLTGVSFSGLPGGATATYDPATGSVIFTGMPVSLGAGVTLTPGVTFTAPANGAVSIASGINTSTSQGSNTLPDTATATSAVSPLADVTTAVSLPPVAIASSLVNGTIAFSNAGPSAAAGMVYVANLATGLGGVTFTGLPAGATAVYNAATGAVTFSGMPAALGAGTSLSIGVAFAAPATGSATIATSVSTATSQGPNTLPDTSSSTTAISPLADVTTSASFPPTALGGSAVNGSVTFANNGPSTATGVTYTLSLSTGLTNVVIGGLPAGAIATYNPATGVVTFTGMPTSLGAGSTLIASVGFTAPPAGSAVVSSTIGTATSQGSNTLPDNASRTTVVSANAQPTADLAIVKVRNGTFVAGGTASYTITVTNNGPSGVAGATVVDTAPAGMTIGNWSCAVTSQGAGGTVTTACGAASGTGNINTSVTMKNGAVISYTVPVTFSAAITGSIANSASVSVPGGITDPSSGNNTTTDTSPINLVSDLSITKTSTPNPFVAGGTLTYTIIASNAGPSNATGVRIQDNLPSPLSSFTWTCVASGAGAACGAASGAGSIDQLVTLATGTQVTLTLTGNVPIGTTTTLNNTASITPPATTTDPTPNNNTATNVNSAAALADMTVAKSHTGTFAQGQVGATYTIIATNSGAAAKAAGNVVAVIDTPPAGVNITAMGGTGWNCVNLPMCLRTDALAAGASYPALTVVVNIGANATSPLVNTAEVSLTGQLEANYNNNTATDSAIVGQPSLADLTIVKTHGGGDFNQGQIARFSIVVTNSGGAPKLAGNLVSVTELAPAGMTITAMRGDGWVCDTLPTCTRTDSLAAGTSYPEVVVIARIAANASSPLGNGARVALTGQLETDPNNNTVIDPAIVVAVPDLVVAKSHVGDFAAGQRGVQFNIVVSNAGSATKIAGNTVEVSEDVPFGLTITSMSGAGWSCPSPGGLPICTRTDLLSPGASYPPIIVLADVAMNAVSPLFNGATVILSGQSESEYGNNFAVDQATIVGSPIPTLGMWALWMLVLAIGGCGAFGSGRRRGSGRFFESSHQARSAIVH